MAAELNIAIRTVNRWSDGRRWPGVEMTNIIRKIARDEVEELQGRISKIVAALEGPVT